MNDTDTKIISILRLDGKISNAAIARQIGVSEETVRTKR